MSDAHATVLAIVEDDSDLRLLIRTHLARDSRLEILGEAASGAEAIAMASALRPGAIILDHGLAGPMTGLEAAPLIKAASPQSKILLFTAYDVEREAAAEPAVDAYLRKDRIGELLATVCLLLGLPPLQ